MFSFNFNLFKSKRKEGDKHERQKNLNDNKKNLNEFDFRFDEREEFVNICLGKQTNKQRQERANTTHARYSDAADEVDLSVDEMIKFSNGIREKKATMLSLRGKIPQMQKRIEKVKSGTYKIDKFPVHQIQYNDKPLEPFEEDRFDDKLSRKIKVCSRRARDYANNKNNVS